MNWFKSNDDEKLKEFLKKSDADFRFDQGKIKYRLLASIDTMDQKPSPGFQFSRLAKYSATFAAVVLILSGTFTFASNAKPGDKLFPLNKLGEQVILNLPLSVEQKAKVEAHIVTNRLEALDQVQAAPEKATPQVQAKKLETLKESDETLTTAIDNITQNKKQLEKSGKTKSAEKLEAVLDQLQIMAEKREATIADLEDKTSGEADKTKIRKHLEQIKASREKAKKEIKRYKNRQDDKKDDNSDD